MLRFKKRGLLSLVLALCLILAAVPAMADLLYTGSEGGFASVGSISGTSAISKGLINVSAGSGQGLYAFTNAAGARRIMLTTQSTIAGTPDTAYIYGYDAENWNLDENRVAAVALAGVNVERGAAQLGGYLYMASYGASGSGAVVKFDTAGDAYTAVASFDLTAEAGEGYLMHAETIVAYGGSLYVVASKHPVGNYTTYENNVLYKLSANDLSIEKKAPLLSKNRDGQCTNLLSGSDLYVTSNPGYGFGTPEIEKISLSDMTSKLLITGTMGDFDFASIYQTPDGCVYITSYLYNYDSGENDYKVYKTTLEKLNAGDITSADVIKEGSGTYALAKMAYDTESSLLWVQAGGLFAYDGTKFLNEEGYKSDVLGCTASHLLAVTYLGKPVPSGDGGSSGGCSAGFAWLALLAVAPLAFYRRKR